MANARRRPLQSAIQETRRKHFASSLQMLKIAIQEKNQKLGLILLEHLFDSATSDELLDELFSYQDESQNSLLALSFQHGCTLIIEKLLADPRIEKEKFLFVKNIQQQSLIWLALQSTAVIHLEKLIEIMKKLNPTQLIEYLSLPDQDGNTPLHAVALFDPIAYSSMANLWRTSAEQSEHEREVFLYVGAAEAILNVMQKQWPEEEFIYQLNRSNKKGESPLHLAIKNNFRMAALFLAKGADFFITDNLGKSAFDYLCAAPFTKQNYFCDELDILQIKDAKKLKRKLLITHYQQFKSSTATKVLTAKEFFRLAMKIRPDLFAARQGEYLEIDEGFLTAINLPSNLLVEQEQPFLIAPLDHQQIDQDRKSLLELIRIFKDKAANVEQDAGYEAKKRIIMNVSLLVSASISIIAFGIVLNHYIHICDEIANKPDHTTAEEVICYDTKGKPWLNGLIFTAVPLTMLLAMIVTWYKSILSFFQRDVRSKEWKEIMNQYQDFYEHMRAAEEMPNTHAAAITQLDTQTNLLHDKQKSEEVKAIFANMADTFSGMLDELNAGHYRKGITLFPPAREAENPETIIPINNSVSSNNQSILLDDDDEINEDEETTATSYYNSSNTTADVEVPLLSISLPGRKT